MFPGWTPPHRLVGAVTARSALVTVRQEVEDFTCPHGAGDTFREFFGDAHIFMIGYARFFGRFHPLTWMCVLGSQGI